MLLSEFTETYYLPYIKQSVRSNTYQGYICSYRKYVKPRFGNTNLEDITTLDVQSWINSFDKPGCARRSYATLRQILRCASDFDVYHGNDPTKHNIKLPKTKGNCNKILTADEVVTLMQGFKDHPLETCVICSVTMGLRRCESFGLKWEDINLVTGEVYVHRSRQCVQGKEVVYPTKTTKSTRVCYLPYSALVRLRQIGTHQQGWILPVPVAKAANLYRSHIESNHLPYTPFMNLRHTWATLAVESGTDISVVANMLGHTDMTMAYNRYVKPRQDVYTQAQIRFNDLMKQNNKVVEYSSTSLIRKIVQRTKSMLLKYAASLL